MNTEKDLHNPETRPHLLRHSLRNATLLLLALIVLSTGRYYQYPLSL